MGPSTKQDGADKNLGVSGHVPTLHQRLCHALSLGTWVNKETWYCSDIEIQRLVLRSIDAFLEGISIETLQYPHVKDSADIMVIALKSILEFKSQSILRFASNVTVKMVNVLPYSRLQTHVSDLIPPLADLLYSQQLQIAMASATAMNIILFKLSSRHDGEVGKILKETKAVGYIVDNIKKFRVDDKPIKYFQEMASVLSKILLRWPFFRFSVWNDPLLLKILDAVLLMSENSVKIVVLQLYSSLVLCSIGGEKLIENGEALLQMLVGCMDSSNACSIRSEAFKLARCLALSRGRCVKMMSICCEPLVQAVTITMNNWISLTNKSDKGQLSVMEEACRLAAITRWAGDHHIHFWKAGVDRLLLHLLLENYAKIHQLQHDLSLNDLVFIVRENYNVNPLHAFRPYAWDILGGLAAHCGTENNEHQFHGNELRLNVVITCTCLSFAGSLGTLRQVSQMGATNMSECESASRAVLMMVYSPCKYIASLARRILCEILKLETKGNVGYLLEILNAELTGNIQILLSLMSLACYCSVLTYKKVVIKSHGIRTMMDFIMRWLNSPVRTKRTSMVPHLRDSLSEKTCCFPVTQEWEGEDMLLILGLWVLAELLQLSTCVEFHPFFCTAEHSETQFIQKIQEICGDDYSHGSRWFAAYVLSFFGLFGLRSKMGKRIGKTLGQKEHSDLKLDINNEDSAFVHQVILTVRCPLLLPPGKPVPKEESTSGPNNVKTVRLSAHVDRLSLLKLLEYVYSGYLQTSADLAKKLKIFARHCKLESLMQLLSNRRPKWDASAPSFDLTPALGPAGYYLSDLILEAGSTFQLTHWKCSDCRALVPHLHVHKVILESGCDYFRALFQSGMQESHLQTFKVPLSWESLNKLVYWLYSDQLPVPTINCVWHNSSPGDKFLHVQSYLELCWLADFWLMEDLHEECYKAAVAYFDSSMYLSTKLIRTAVDFSQWKLAQVIAERMAPLYHHLRSSGELDAVDDKLVEMIRVASVTLSRKGASQNSSSQG